MARLLDAACGSGLAATFARRLGAEVHGIDASEELLTIDACYFLAVAACSPPDEGDGVVEPGKIAQPGVAETMLTDAGLRLLERGTVGCASEWPDREVAVRALAAPGVAHHAIRHSGLETFVATALDAIQPFQTPNGYRLTSDVDYVIATKS